MTAYNVAGAGSAGANKNYIPDITPVYSWQNGDFSLQWNGADGAYFLWDNYSGLQLYRGDDGVGDVIPSLTPNLCTWSAVDGSAPVPTVTVAIPSYVFAGAGDTEWDGEYFDMGLGTDGLYTFFGLDSGHYLCYDDMDFWWCLLTYIDNNMGATNPSYANSGNYGDGPLGAWSDAGFGATAPAPTIEAYSGGGGETPPTGNMFLMF